MRDRVAQRSPASRSNIRPPPTSPPASSRQTRLNRVRSTRSRRPQAIRVSSHHGSRICPSSSTVPSPLKFWGRIAGAPGELVGTEKAYAYCRALAAASPRVRVFTIGKSEEGRDIILLAIADEAGIRDLEKMKAATAISPTRAAPILPPRKNSSPHRARSTTSMPRCIQTKPVRPKPRSSLPIASPSPNSR